MARPDRFGLFKKAQCEFGKVEDHTTWSNAHGNSWSVFSRQSKKLRQKVIHACFNAR